MSIQIEQLILLYKQLYNISLTINELIGKEDYDEIISQEICKAQLVSRITLAKKTIRLSDAENKELEEWKNKIMIQEDDNLHRIGMMKNNVLAQLKAINSQNKVVNKYEHVESVEGSICDYTSD